MAAVSGLGTERVRIVCPKCERQEPYEIALGQGRQALTCIKCTAGFATHLAVVRSRRSSASKKENRRRFSVRVQNFNGTEDLVEFVNATTQEFELRSKDVVAFSYLNDHLRVVQNVTINKHMNISTPSCFIASCVYGIDGPEVLALRDWRDRQLLPSLIGARLVSGYYSLSEPLVRAAVRTAVTTSLVRILGRAILAPLLWHTKRDRGRVLGGWAPEASDKTDPRALVE
jgi:hypothetical protein